MANKLYIDGLDLYSTYGIGLTISHGELDYPKRKKSISYNWKDEHGDDVDVSHHYYESRVITLDLFIYATSSATLLTNLKAFFTAMRAAGLRKLKFKSMPKVYMVYMDDDIKFERKGSLSSSNIALKFTLKLVEPNPVNRQFTTIVYDPTSCSITLTSTKTLTIYWGDGTSDDITGTAQTKSKTYPSAGTKNITLAGDIDTISGFSQTNLTEI